MRVYLDVSCLNRPFDDQSQVRVHLEAEAVLMVLKRVEAGEWRHVTGEITVIEVNAMPDQDKKQRVLRSLPKHSDIMLLSPEQAGRATELTRLGLKAADALHVAAAEALRADVLLSCDDQLCRLAARHHRELGIRVMNPVDWLKEAGDGDDS